MNTGSTVWWAQFVTPGATILGILIGFLLNWARDARAERRRWERDDKFRAEQQRQEDVVRYNRERIEAYATFLRLSSAAVSGNYGPDTGDDSPEDRALMVEFRTAYHRVGLLGSEPVRRAATGVLLVVIDLSPTTRHIRRPDEPPPSHALHREREDAFSEAARRELGVQE